MRTWGKKCVLVFVAMVIALGSAAMITGCKKSEPAAAPPAPDTNVPAEKAPAPPAQ